MEELKPCKFCGGEGHILVYSSSYEGEKYSVSCNKCHIRTKPYLTIEEAIVEWENAKRLKPCPFCGGEATIEQAGWPHHVYCTFCGANVKSIRFETEGEQECIEKWNRRVNDGRTD